MSNVQILRGGAPVKNTILVNVDNETVFGDGSIEDPIRAEPGGEPITTEDLVVNTAGGAADPDVTVSFVTYSGLVPEAPNTVNITLADGATDGQTKQIGFEGATNIEWRITPASFDGTRIDFPDGLPGGATFNWDADLGKWFVSGMYNGTLT